MIIIDQTIVSEDLIEAKFVCDLIACKGQCCESGDFGAPLLDEELEQMDANLAAVLPYLSEETQKQIATSGYHTIDVDGELCTTLINHKECVFALKDENKHWKCMFERAYLDNKSTFRKPSSCFLYPVRLKKYTTFTAVNYDRWDICSPACSNGENLKVPLYQFLRIPLTEKFGTDWYDQLEAIAKEYKKK